MPLWKATLILAFLFTAHISASEKLPDRHISQWELGENINGEPITPELLSGKVALLTHWGIRSEPSLDALTTLAALDKKHRASGLVTIAAEVQETDRAAVLEVIKQKQLTYPVLLGSKGPESDGKGVPKSYLFDTTGKLVFVGHPNAPGLQSALNTALLTRSREQIAAGIDAGAPDTERTWTLADGSQITASMIEKREDSVKLRLPGGRVLTKKIAELSQKEQRRLAE